MKRRLSVPSCTRFALAPYRAGVTAAVLCLLLLGPPGPAFAGEIHQAVIDGDAPRVEALLASDRSLASSPDESDPFRSLPLHFAAMHGRVEIAKLLLNAGARVDDGDSDGSTPLDCAAQRRKAEMVEFLLARGANPNRRDRNGAYALSFAASAGDSSLVARLLEAGADLHFRSADGLTLLHYAASRRMRGFAQQLIDQGVDPDTASLEGITPVHLCVRPGLAGMIRFLHDRGADVDRPDRHGWTPLAAAVSLDDPEPARLLLEYGARADRRHFGSTLLHRAAMEGKTEIAGLLLDAGADPAAVDSLHGFTPAHWGALYGHGDLVRRLLAAGAPVDAKDPRGRTPWSLAARYGHHGAAEALRGAGARGAKEWAQIAPTSPLREDLRPGEAQVVHLGHSGWLVRTSQHVLVFDYWTAGRPPDEPALVNGFIDPAELAGRDVHVFASHSHRDHFDPAIFSWREALPGVHYVLGFPPQDPPVPCDVLEGRQTRAFGDLEVTAIRANDSGVGFLVRADGVTIFHAGDHANRQREVTADFAAEFDFLAEKRIPVDLAFLPVSGCGFGDPEAVRLGVEHALRRLQPKAFFPMHALHGEERLAQFVTGCGDRFPGVAMQAAESRGDLYRFRDGKLAWAGNGE